MIGNHTISEIIQTSSPANNNSLTLTENKNSDEPTLLVGKRESTDKWSFFYGHEFKPDYKYEIAFAID